MTSRSSRLKNREATASNQWPVVRASMTCVRMDLKAYTTRDKVCANAVATTMLLGRAGKDGKMDDDKQEGQRMEGNFPTTPCKVMIASILIDNPDKAVELLDAEISKIERQAHLKGYELGSKDALESLSRPPPPSNASDSKQEEQQTSPLPWKERVTMLSINPDAATLSDIANMAAELVEVWSPRPPPPGNVREPEWASRREFTVVRGEIYWTVRDCGDCIWARCTTEGDARIIAVALNGNCHEREEDRG